MPNETSTLRFKSDVGYADDCDAIFPILRNDGGTPTIVGTGFYICTNGIFVTATHCFEHEGKIASDRGFAIFHLPADGTYLQRPILRAWHSSRADVSVGVAAPMTHNPTGTLLRNKVMVVTAERPAPATSIATYAFGDSHCSSDGPKTKIILEPRFSEGKIIDYFPNGRDRSMIHWPVYETSMPFLGGASGGPVVGPEGTVFAVNTSSIDGHPDISYVTPIDFILDAEIENIAIGVGASPKNYKVRDLARMGHVSFRPPFPSREA